jgi:hypothetical protein
VPHGLHGGFNFCLPREFGQSAITATGGGGGNNKKVGHSFWEEIAVRPDVAEELLVHNVLPQVWNVELSDQDRYAQLTPLQTTGSGDCLLNALSLGMFGVQDRTRSLAIGDIVDVNLGGDVATSSPPMKCRIVEVTPDGSAVGVVPLDTNTALSSDESLILMQSDNEPMVVPCSNIVGEADTDSLDHNLLHEGGLFSQKESSRSLALGAYSSGTILSREWASLRLLLSCCMRESGDVLFPRWARDRVADTNDESPLPPAPSAQMIASESGSEPTSEQEKDNNSNRNEFEEGSRSSADIAAAAALEEGFVTSQRLRDDWFESLDDAGTPKRSLLPEHVW